MARRVRLRVFVPDGHGGRRLSNGAFGLSLILLLVIGLGTVLVLSTQIQQQQTELEELQDQAKLASYHEAALQGEVNELSTTNSLARMAAALGMVPNTNPLIIQMPEGTSHGTPAAMDGSEMPGVVPAESAPATPQAGASPTSPASSGPSAGTAEPAPRDGQDQDTQQDENPQEAQQETEPVQSDQAGG
ncbi:hypothetical protein [Propionibacterium australiense]|uniref:Cell division protein FtsL n=1 Tax=Propionibacterium australiense TaxID=119981 RepID=A0A383S5M1_9ACTN|nr:hypothetical protein [Propionibacterium australiense]RLP11181.1 hypothetical protein D7U36_05265 [Propionibacterium australiense]RLP12510.1 hypothetical protein D9T14_01300 [Propionibacterium australiense]SYZ32669.1 Hypothetical protein PROPAUS_0558 [Propionibacterium australiense]VEH91581.1 Uncharacterised protein [Propionibacterium australiense]